uniref:Putative group i salivary lipocalin n=1 Tax=Rhipicephalus pulchellus TaxID=72859 RepID=L7LT27_RHIPC
MYSSTLTLLIATIVGANAVSLLDLMKALHTYQKIWIRYRSYEKHSFGHKHKCVYSEVRMYDLRHYLLTQHYEVDGKWRTMQNYATLFQGKGGEPVMRVSFKPGKYGVDHRLVFWHPVEHCFVFTRGVEGTNQCEMWVWSDHVRKHVPQCQLAYKRHCIAQYPVYTHACGNP